MGLRYTSTGHGDWAPTFSPCSGGVRTNHPAPPPSPTAYHAERPHGEDAEKGRLRREDSTPEHHARSRGGSGPMDTRRAPASRPRLLPFSTESTAPTGMSAKARSLRKYPGPEGPHRRSVGASVRRGRTETRRAPLSAAKRSRLRDRGHPTAAMRRVTPRRGDRNCQGRPGSWSGAHAPASHARQGAGDLRHRLRSAVWPELRFRSTETVGGCSWPPAVRDPLAGSRKGLPSIRIAHLAGQRRPGHDRLALPLPPSCAGSEWCTRRASQERVRTATHALRDSSRRQAVARCGLREDERLQPLGFVQVLNVLPSTLRSTSCQPSCSRHAGSNSQP